MTKTLTKKNPVGWFEIPTHDMSRARKFYASTFDFELDKPQDMEGFKMSFFPMERGGQGAGGALIQGDGYTPSHEGTLVYFMVDDMKATEEKIASNGGRVYKPKTSIGEYGYIAICEDSEGNRIALHSMS